MKNWGFICALCLLFVVGCGQVKTTEESQGPKAEAPVAPQPPTPVPSTDDDALNQGAPSDGGDGQAFTPIAKNQGKNSNDGGATLPPPPALQKDIPDSDVQLKTDANTKAEKKIIVTEVLGLGTDGEAVSHLLDRGYPAAIFEANLCRASGSFSNHSRCMIVFKDGHSEWVSGANRELITPFIEQLQQHDDGKKSRPKVKKHKKFLIF